MGLKSGCGPGFEIRVILWNNKEVGKGKRDCVKEFCFCVSGKGGGGGGGGEQEKNKIRSFMRFTSK